MAHSSPSDNQGNNRDDKEDNNEHSQFHWSGNRETVGCLIEGFDRSNAPCPNEKGNKHKNPEDEEPVPEPVNPGV